MQKKKKTNEPFKKMVFLSAFQNEFWFKKPKPLSPCLMQSKGRIFEAHHDPCSLLEGEATLPSPEKKTKKQLHVVLKQGTTTVRRDELYSSCAGPFPRG